MAQGCASAGKREDFGGGQDAEHLDTWSRDGVWQIGNYELLEVLGEGGMASVYLARHRVLHTYCAIKMLRPALAQRDALRAQFKLEARLTASVKHPNLVEIRDYLEDETHGSFLVLELVGGMSLSARLAEGPLELPAFFAVATAVARALVAVHAAGIVHRDVKASNVLLVDDGTVKLIDFGIAKRCDDHDDGSPDHPMNQAMTGTPGYMAPEQFSGGAVGDRADVYAMGSLFFEMLTGDTPFDADDLTQLGLRVRFEHPPAIPRVVPPELADLILECLAKQPDARPSAQAVLTKLEELAGSVPSATIGVPAPESTDSGEVVELEAEPPQRTVARVAIPLHREDADPPWADSLDWRRRFAAGTPPPDLDDDEIPDLRAGSPWRLAALGAVLCALVGACGWYF